MADWRQFNGWAADTDCMGCADGVRVVSGGEFGEPLGR